MDSPTHSHGTQIARQSSSPKSAPGQPHPRPTAAVPSSTTRPPAPNALGSHEGTPQRPLSLSPASSSTIQTLKTAECLADVSGMALGVATGEFLSLSSLVPSLVVPSSGLFLTSPLHSPSPSISFIIGIISLFDSQLILDCYSQWCASWRSLLSLPKAQPSRRFTPNVHL